VFSLVVIGPHHWGATAQSRYRERRGALRPKLKSCRWEQKEIPIYGEWIGTLERLHKCGRPGAGHGDIYSGRAIRKEPS